MASIGRVLGYKYKLLRMIGQGGMGAVYLAENILTGRKVAVKTLHAPFAQQGEAVDRFWQEARAASQIDHPNIVSVLDADVDADLEEPFIVQELLLGANLRDYLDAREDPRLTVAEAVSLLLPIVDALVAAHEAGIVHRDLKPANIFLTRHPSGNVVPKLIDFGVSKLLSGDAEASFRTATGVSVGTPAYMSPEQARGERDIDGRADVWSIGVLFFQLLTAKLPYDAPNHHMLVAKIINGTPRRIEKVAPELALPDDLVALIHRAVEPERALRVESMEAFRDALLAMESLEDVLPGAGPGKEVELAAVTATESSRPSRRTRGTPPPVRAAEPAAPPPVSSGATKAAAQHRESLVLLACACAAALLVLLTLGFAARRRTTSQEPTTQPSIDASAAAAHHLAMDAAGTGRAIDATVAEDRATDVRQESRSRADRHHARSPVNDPLAPDETIYRSSRRVRRDDR